jgi:hypothetical protein
MGFREVVLCCRYGGGSRYGCLTACPSSFERMTPNSLPDPRLNGIGLGIPLLVNTFTADRKCAEMPLRSASVAAISSA